MISRMGKMEQKIGTLESFMRGSLLISIKGMMEQWKGQQPEGQQPEVQQSGKSSGGSGKDESHKLSALTSSAGEVVEELSVDNYWDMDESKNNIPNICCLYGCAFLLFGKKHLHLPILVDISAASDADVQSEAIMRFYKEDCQLDHICFIASDGSDFFGVKLQKKSSPKIVQMRIETNFNITDGMVGVSPKTQLITIAKSVGHAFFGDQVVVKEQITVDDDVSNISDVNQTEQLAMALFFTCGVLEEDSDNPHYLIPPKNLYEFFDKVKDETFPDDMTIEHLLCQMMLSNMTVHYQLKGKIHDTSSNIWKKLKDGDAEYHLSGLFNGLFQFHLLS